MQTHFLVQEAKNHSSPAANPPPLQEQPPKPAFLEEDEPPMTASGGNLIGGEISRNEQCPLCGLATIEAAEGGNPFFGPQRTVSPTKK